MEKSHMLYLKAQHLGNKSNNSFVNYCQRRENVQLDV